MSSDMRSCSTSIWGRLRAPASWFAVLVLAGFASRAIAESIPVVVSILPEKYFVERVGGLQVDVSVLVGPGQSPETYEPSPQQMTALARARVYFSIGVPFETAWMDRIRAANHHMRVVNMAAGIKLRPIDRIDASGGNATGPRDPHVWLSPLLVRRMSVRIRDELVTLDPAHKRAYERNQAAFAAALGALDAEIRARFASLKQRAFVTFHPSWGYFADAYGLRQIPIESEGKEPAPRTLLYVIDEAKRLGITTVFIEPQFSRGNAEMVAHEIGGQIVAIDPLAEDYIENMHEVVAAFAEGAGKK